MIIVFFGQPHSGKTTLARELQKQIFLSKWGYHTPIVDGDDIRDIFNNKDFSTEGRLKNLSRISDIATFLDRHYNYVIVSAVYPLKAARTYLNSLNKQVVWVHLKYNELRGREVYHVIDFQNIKHDGIPYLELNTSELSVKECIDKTLLFMHDFV